MNSVSKLTIGAALGLAALAGGSPALAQAPYAAVSLSKPERATLLAVSTALSTGNYSAASSALAAAKAAAVGADARHYVAQFQYQIALASNDYRVQTDALQTMIASGRVPAAAVPAVYGQIGSVAYNHLFDYSLAERSFAAQVAAAPGSAEGLTNLARVKVAMKKPQEAQPLLVRAIAAQKAIGQRVPESWYKMALDLAYRARNAAQFSAVSRDFLLAFPSRQNWRDVILVQRELQGADPAASLDLLRLMRASDALGGERDYFELATALDSAGFAGEAKAVLQEGASARMVDTAKGVAKDLLARSTTRAAQEKASLAGLKTRAASDSTGAAALKAADTALSQSDYAEAASLYQAAVQKGSVDPNLANSRLGIALALAGRKPEAEAAFRSVSGPRAELAAYWLTWLGQRA